MVELVNMTKDKYNPVEEFHLEERERFDALPEEQKKIEIDRLHEQALVENVPRFYDIREKITDPEEKEAMELAIKVCEAVKEEGGLALVVGGFARDTALAKFGYNLKPKDIDIEVYGLDFDKLKDNLSKIGEINVVGSAFGVIKLKSLDISIPRRDSKTGRGHKGFTIEGDPNMFIKEAAKRRDFTINALALDPLTGEILDFYGGIDDIKNKKLRVTDKETFVDDPLRVLRAAQFSARFGFDVDEETKELCRSLDLSELSKERIGEEWLKLLLKAPRPSIGLEMARELRILDQLHPEIKTLIGIPQNPDYHPEGDVWNHTKMVVDSAVEVSQERSLTEEEKRALILSALCHDLGKPATTKVEESGKITSYGHEDAGLEPSQRFLDMLHINQALAEKVLILVKEHMFVHNNPSPSDSAIRRLAKRLYPATIQDLVYLSTADMRGAMKPGAYEAAENLLKKSEELAVEKAKPQPLIMGRDLLEIGFEPGIKIGQTLKEIEELQLDGKIADYGQAQEYAKSKLIELHSAELQDYGLQGLEGRIQRGLDPAGMLAVHTTRKLIEKIINELNIRMVDLDRLTKELHTGAVWAMAEELSKAEKPEVKAWMLLADECHEVNNKDLSTNEYISDFNRIRHDLELIEKDPVIAVDRSVSNITAKSIEKFSIKDGVPFSEEDAFLYMAIAGKKFGVCRAGDLYFVGADQLDYSILEKDGLISVNKEDRGRIASFFQKDGKDIVKKLYPGLAIVFGDEELALKLAKSAKK